MDEQRKYDELDDLLRKMSFSDPDLFRENAALLEREVFNEEFSDTPLYQKGEEVVSKLQKSFGDSRTTTIWPTFFKIAAIVLLLIGIGTIVTIFNKKSNQDQVIATDSSNKSKFFLPDSSEVWLNKNSSLAFSNIFKKRVVKLNGEAFFEVRKAKGHNFVISVNNTEIEVLGTKFNVKQTEGDIRVSVLEGKVKFSDVGTHKDMILNANETGVYNTETGLMTTIPGFDMNCIAWKTETLYFEMTPMAEVVKILSEHYEREVIINDKAIGKCKIIATFENQPLEEILNELKLILNIEYNFQGSKVIIIGEGC